MKKIYTFIILVILAVMALKTDSLRADTSEEEIVIVIDPGHGGSQKGAEYNGLMEKDINMKVSLELAAELSRYDNIKIYLTHDSTEDEMSIKERAEFAKKVNADYFFCIHFNASGNHNFYGAETWITSYGRYYSLMYAFSEIVLGEFEEMGLFNRGIKTKLETDGTDYYGVLRRGAEFDIPAVIIEHCHMDNAADEKFLNEDAYRRFGQADATAIAKFLHLKSSETGADYSDYKYDIPAEPEEKIKNDETNPECIVKVTDYDLDTGKVQLSIEASDEEYPILYYGYSFDGGLTYTELYPWTGENGIQELYLDYFECRGKNVVVCVYNAYNLSQSYEVTKLDENVGKIAGEKEGLREQQEAADTGVSVETISGGEVYLYIAIAAIIMAIGVILVFMKNIKGSS